MTNYPLLKLGTFGVHILKNPAGTFSFVGTVPVDLAKTICQTYDAAEQTFIEWFKAMPVSEQREYAGDLRNDIFAKVFSS